MKDNNKPLFTAANLVKGIAIGSAMLVPGLSGGTIAIICGIYDKLLAAVASIRQNPKKNLAFLAAVAIGGIIGMLLFSKIILLLFQTYQMPVMFFFIGAVLGSIPMLYRCTQIKRFSYHMILYPAIGIVFVILMIFIPENTFIIEVTHIQDYALLLLIGIFLAVALVLPGISFSYMLLIMGIYESALTAIQEMQILYLSLLGAGIVIGIILISKMFKALLTRYPKETYLMIIGFVLASLKDVFPGLPNAENLLICIATLLIGFLLIFFLSKKYTR
ncbi:MAG: DUF368 domain-containing protein [Bacillota bacterium]|jgi:putative membrane protein